MVKNSYTLMKAKRTERAYTLMKVRRTERAYTLIEILVTLTIVGILFTVGYVGFRDFSRRQALAGAVKEIQGNLSLTQGYALAGQKPDNIFCSDPNSSDPPNLIGYNFNVVSSSEYKIEAVCTGGTVLQEDFNLDASSGISIGISPTNPVLFKVLGAGTNIPAESSGDVITLTQAGTNNQATITVGAGGEIR
jgi:prepilin-type N-terminal cleavage/methylation domain-containing protein